MANKHIEPDRIALSLQIDTIASGRDNGRDSESVIDQVLDEIRHDDSISVTQIAKKLGISERTIGRHIKQLKEAGELMREGTKNGKWIIR